MGVVDVSSVLSIQLIDTEIGDVSISQYLQRLLKDLWVKEESFSSKRPFGNSCWKFDVYKGLIREGLINGELDDDGYLDSCDNKAGDKIITQCIDNLFN